MNAGNDGIIDSITRRKLLGGAGATLALGSLAGCSGNTESSSKLKFAQAKGPIEFDPIVLNDVPSAEIAQLIFDSLYTYGAETELNPSIAKSMPEVERGGQRWIVELKDDATFQNGDTVTAEDVTYTFRQPVKESTENAGEFNMIESATAVDEKTVQFDLKYQFGAFKHYLPFEIVSKSAREGNKQSFNKENPVGAGPYEFDEWKQGEYVRLKKWGDYWADPTPNVETIEFKPVTEGTTRVTTLKTGKNDVIKTVPPNSWSTVENMDKASINAVPSVSYFYLAFNCNEGPTQNAEVREAIDYLVSMDEAVSQFVEPSGVRQYAPVPEQVSEEWDFPVDDWKGIRHEKDIDRGKSMLESSDAVPSDWSARIIVPPDNKREQVGISVANGIKEAGFDATVQRLDWGKFTNQYVTGEASDYNMFTLGWSGAADPDTFMYFLFSQEMEGVTNGSYYDNDTVDQQIMDARESTDRDERKRLYEEAVPTLLEDRVHLPAYALKNNFGVRNRVSDFAAHPIDQFHFTSGHNNVSLQ
ncbi:ABC transporter substrate-binding protein [Halorientalis sp. IM1011]|uniref:ABC transporter substrate-binding protein n=1 Tax=Halorientalis sp. IM1011 TaxID=1932360 RepID=UPI00097CD143|nr:ABC transporter substrate-binding protein [Halorientalis sp. IM1011]AQL43390.1 ABC transporter substrate-binding protein [Halorientalis sp. IM1011]